MAEGRTKIVLTAVSVCTLIFVVDLIRSSFFRDLSYLVTQRECEERLSAVLRKLQSGTNSLDELPVAPSGHEYVLFVSAETPFKPSANVAIADSKLLHKQRLSFGLPLYYAVVLLEDGTRLTWEGTHEDYDRTVLRAIESETNRSVSVFWEFAWNRNAVLRELRR